jgi:hypothetical protein
MGITFLRMRLLVMVLLLLTPLQSVAALAFCLGVEHGAAAPCDPGMGAMSEGNEERPGAIPASAGTAHLLTISLSDRATTEACGAVGLCSAPVPSVASTVVGALPERGANTLPSSLLPHLGPGIRPAPPPHPPRA